MSRMKVFTITVHPDVGGIPSGNNSVELFNAYNSLFNVNTINNPTIYEPFHGYPPWTPRQPAGLNNDYLSFLSNGDGLAWDSTFGEGIVISCRQYPYRSLLEYSKSNPFNVVKIRLTGDPDQIAKEFKFFEKSPFGFVDEKIISPTDYIKPNDIQSNFIDVPFKETITGTTGIIYYTFPNRTISFDFFCT